MADLVQHAIYKTEHKMLNMKIITLNKQCSALKDWSFKMPYVFHCQTLAQIPSKKRSILLIIILALGLNSHASIYHIGPTQTYISPNSLYLAGVIQDGDTIEIDSAIYTGQAALAVWQNNNLLIRGVGGRPSLVANGQYIWGAGIWVLAGDNITVENIEFSGATVPNQNGAGLRLYGTGLTVRHCYFHNNENGILTSNPYAGNILIEFSEFGYNGYGDGYSHNVYIGHVNSLTFRFNYSHHANVGHTLKSRAKENYILYNRIMDEQTGNASILIEIPNGGFSIIMGNLLMQGDNAVNNTMIGYGLEGLTSTAPHEVYIINNTFVNKRVASCRFVFVNSSTGIANLTNNIFAGTGTIFTETSTGATSIVSNNYVNTNISNLKFVNEPAYNYHLNSTSPAINYGTTVNSVNGHSLIPDSTYEHPETYGLRAVYNGSIDAGAYEYMGPLSIAKPVTELLTVFPNPTGSVVNVETNKKQISLISVYDLNGRFLLSKPNSKTVDLSDLKNGLYYLKIEMNEEKDKVITKLIIKE